MENTAELTIVDAKEFGIEATRAIEINKSFLPKLQEREILDQQYNDLLTQELTPEVASEAKSLRLKYVKVRTGTDAIHKTEKAFSLAYGRFVDALKNKMNLPVEQREEKLFEIEDYFPKLDRERIAKVKSDREALLLQYVTNPESYNVGVLDQPAFDNLLNGLKLGFEDNQRKLKEAEDLRIEFERKQLLFSERASKLAPYQFVYPGVKSLNIDTDEDQFNTLITEAVEAKRLDDKAQQDQILENNRLQAEREAREKEIAAEREMAEKLRQEEAAKQKAIQDKKDAELKAEREAREKLESENKARLENDAKSIKAAELAAKKLAAAPDRDKLINWINSMSVNPVEVSDPELSAIAQIILTRFNGFKTWALNELKDPNA